MDPTQPVSRSQDHAGHGRRNSLAPRRFVVRLLGFFAAVALFMAALGLYGVISYSVAQRTQEIGVRMALGAESGSLLGMVVGQGLRLAALGVVIGLILAMACSRLLESQFFGVSPLDPVTLRFDCGGAAGRGFAGELSSGQARHAGGSAPRATVRVAIRWS